MEKEEREKIVKSYIAHMHPALNFPVDHAYQRELGYGSEATVALWSHILTNKLLAVKSLCRRQFMTDKPPIPHEVTILKDLPPHTHIIRLHAFYSGVGRLGQDCILYEYCPAGDLFELRELSYKQGRLGIFTEKFMWNLFSQLAAAIAYLHEGIGASPGTNTDWWKPILHRDLKVENIFIKSLGTQSDWSSLHIKLGDFGHAVVYDEDNRKLPLGIGTPDCWPPEITPSDRPYGPEADVWAVGCVIHELAHGFPPVDSMERTREIILRGRRDLLPKGWEEWCEARKNHFFKVAALRNPLPINLPAHQQRPDPRSFRKCPQYSADLNSCMMTALTKPREARTGAGILKELVDSGHSYFVYEELKEMNKRLLEEEKQLNGKGSDEDTDSSDYGQVL